MAKSPTARETSGSADKRRRGDQRRAKKDAEILHVEEQLDHALDETFPASDPISIDPRSD
jgi:hypothetical protein